MHAFWNNYNLKPPVATKLAVRHTSLVCLTASFLVTGGFVKLFHKIPWLFRFFFQIPCFFLCMELFPVIYQVFQSLWEPWTAQTGQSFCCFQTQSIVVDDVWDKILDLLPHQKRQHSLKGAIVRPPDKSAYWKIIFLISHPNHMLWVLKRTVSMRRF